MAVCLLHPKTTDAEFQELWKKIDSDESGHLDQEELATYFGFNLHEMEDDLQENRKRASMTDEQVLEALQARQLEAIGGRSVTGLPCRRRFL